MPAADPALRCSLRLSGSQAARYPESRKALGRSPFDRISLLPRAPATCLRAKMGCALCLRLETSPMTGREQVSRWGTSLLRGQLRGRTQQSRGGIIATKKAVPGKDAGWPMTAPQVSSSGCRGGYT